MVYPLYVWPTLISNCQMVGDWMELVMGWVNNIRSSGGRTWKHIWPPGLGTKLIRTEENYRNLLSLLRHQRSYGYNTKKHLATEYGILNMYAGPWFNIKMSSYQYRKSHCGDKTVVRSSYLHNGISYAGKMISFYWIGHLESKTICLLFIDLKILTSVVICLCSWQNLYLALVVKYVFTHSATSVVG